MQDLKSELSPTNKPEVAGVEEAASIAEMHYFFDSSFPTGSLGHSNGFETFASRMDTITTRNAVSWIQRHMIFSLWYGDLENISLYYELASSLTSQSKGSTFVGIIDSQSWDLSLHATRTTYESRKAQESLAKALQRSTGQFFGTTNTTMINHRFTEPSSVVGIIAGSRNWEITRTRTLYLMREVTVLSSVLVRYGKIGQHQQLEIIHELLSNTCALACSRPKDSTVPGIKVSIENELDQLDHPDLRPRLFTS